jgi:hypothetical protein
VAHKLFILCAAAVAFKRFQHKQKAALINGNLRKTNMSASVLRGLAVAAGWKEEARVMQ